MPARQCLSTIVTNSNSALRATLASNWLLGLGLLAAVGTYALIAASTASAAPIVNLVRNGSFERPGFTAPLDSRYQANGSTAIQSWTIIDDGIGEQPFWMHRTGYPTDVTDSTYALALNQGAGAATTVPLTQGVRYVLSFFDRPASSGGAAGVTAMPLRITLGTFDTTIAPPKFLLQRVTLSFVAGATNAAATLQLLNTAPAGDFQSHVVDGIQLAVDGGATLFDDFTSFDERRYARLADANWQVSAAGALRIQKLAGGATSLTTGGAGLRALLVGDFDIQVSYQLDTFLQNDQAQINLYSAIPTGPGVAPFLFCVRRNAVGTAAPGDYSVFANPPTVCGTTPTTDLTGFLRITRSGADMTGWRRSAGGDWIALCTLPIGTMPVGVALVGQNNTGNPAMDVRYDGLYVRASRIAWQHTMYDDLGALPASSYAAYADALWSIAPSAGQIRISKPAGGSTGVTGSGFGPKTQLLGDFDIQGRFQLDGFLTGDQAQLNLFNGACCAGPQFVMDVSRDAAVTAAPGGYMVFTPALGNCGYLSANEPIGVMRANRTGSTITGWRRLPTGEWTPICTRTIGTGPMSFTLIGQNNGGNPTMDVSYDSLLVSADGVALSPMPARSDAAYFFETRPAIGIFTASGSPM